MKNPVKQAFLLMGALALIVAALEISAAWLYRLVNQTPLPREELLTKLERRSLAWKSVGLEDLTGLPQHMTNKVVHPFLGFVADPNQPGVNQHGFFGADPVVQRSDQTLNVALVGGSVALDVFGVFSEVLENRLVGTTFANRELKTFCLALDGYKQPQQLMALSYFLSLGSQFDVVVNLDGFNEIALPYAENVVFGVDVFFPRSWHMFAGSNTDPGIAGKVLEVHRRKAEYETWRQRFDTGFTRSSDLALILWSAVDVWKGEQRRKADNDLRELLRETPELPRDQGISDQYSSQEELFSDLVRMWKESSRLMSQLTQGSGSSYFHFLQPNQYVAGSKPFSDVERTRAITPGPFRDAAELGYPLLIEAGRELQSTGVPFWDLTGIFQENAGTLYVDNCCHLSPEGNRILAERMAAIVLKSLAGAGS